MSVTSVDKWLRSAPRLLIVYPSAWLFVMQTKPAHPRDPVEGNTFQPRLSHDLPSATVPAPTQRSQLTAAFTACLCTSPLPAKSYSPQRLSGELTVMTPAVQSVNHVSLLTPPFSPLPAIRPNKSVNALAPGDGILLPLARGRAMSCFKAGEILTDAADITVISRPCIVCVDF